MTDKKKTIRSCEFFSICEAACGGTLEEVEICSCYEIFKQLKRKEQKLDKIKDIVTDNDSLVQDYQTAYDLAIDILQIIEGGE